MGQDRVFDEWRRFPHNRAVSGLDVFSVAILLGVVEGLTEFLPVSSTGHLILAGHLLGFTGERAAAFEVFIQLGAILAVVWLYRSPLTVSLVGFLRGRPEAWRLAVNLLLGFVPAGVVGLLLHRVIKAHLFNPTTVGVSLVVGGVAIWLIEAGRPAGRISTLDAIPALRALAVGVAQCASLVPGVSRAAATIFGGMLVGLDRQTATIFSFYLAIPTMLAASTFDLVKIWSRLAPGDLGMFLAGFVVSFLAGLAGIRFLLRYLATHDFKAFAYYRIVFGAGALIYFLTRPA
jgi:undecaprenyl-diphosphatase